MKNDNSSVVKKVTLVSSDGDCGTQVCTETMTAENAWNERYLQERKLVHREMSEEIVKFLGNIYQDKNKKVNVAVAPSATVHNLHELTHYFANEFYSSLDESAQKESKENVLYLVQPINVIHYRVEKIKK